MVRADGKLFVGQVFSEFVLAIAIDTQSIVRRIMVPGGGEGAIAASRDGRYIYTSRAIGRTAYLLLPAPRTSTKPLITQQADGAACVFFRIRQSRCSTSVSSEAENLNGTSYVGGNCFLATYDLTELRSINNLYLAEVENGRSDDSTPICLRATKMDASSLGCSSQREVSVASMNTDARFWRTFFRANRHQ